MHSGHKALKWFILFDKNHRTEWGHPFFLLFGSECEHASSSLQSPAPSSYELRPSKSENLQRLVTKLHLDSCERANYSSAPSLNARPCLWRSGSVCEEAVGLCRRSSEAAWPWLKCQEWGSFPIPRRKPCSFPWRPWETLETWRQEKVYIIKSWNHANLGPTSQRKQLCLKNPAIIKTLSLRLNDRNVSALSWPLFAVSLATLIMNDDKTAPIRQYFLLYRALSHLWRNRK